MNMERIILVLIIGLAMLGTASAADKTKLLMVDKIQQSASVDVPPRGLKMDQVRSDFGEPSNIKGPVGQPPITVWEYPQFNVYFEEDYVIDSVVHFRPAT